MSKHIASWLRALVLVAAAALVPPGASPAFAQDAAAQPAPLAQPVPAIGQGVALAPLAADVPAAAPAPAPAKGDTAWMFVSTLLVIMMAIPGLALFYGGLVRSKNMVSVLLQVLMIFSLVIVLWFAYGYSLAFSAGSPFIGSFDRALLAGIWDPARGAFSYAATFSKGVVIPEFIFAAFQGAFAAITCGLVVGAFAERARFSAILLFTALWFTFGYLPVAHMVWFWAGPDAITDAATLAATTEGAGWLWQMGALDFAGGTVVHINAAVAGLVGSVVIGKRIGYGRESMAPHSLALTMVGASLLWVGWFGFNAGSALEANDIAALAFINTLLATAAATLSWVAGEWVVKGKPSLLGAASGAVSGLVAITPACGFVGPGGALAIGFAGGLACLWGVNGLKRLIGADDSLDVFGVHGVGGMVGALLTAVFAAPELGGQGIFDYVANRAAAEYSMAGQLLTQAKAVGVTIVWSALTAFAAYKVADLLLGLRVPEDEEREGLDITSHGESAYHA